jgi:DNA-binding MarR family transcriptional regulator
MEDRTATYDALKIENQLCFPLYACARRVTGQYTDILKPLNLTYTQYLVMLVLWERDQVSVGELGRTLYLDSGTLTPLLHKLEKAGYVTRRRSSEDERIVRITLTREGRALREKAEGIPQRIGSCVRISREEAQTLYTLLYRILDGIESPEGPEPEARGACVQVPEREASTGRRDP